MTFGPKDLQRLLKRTDLTLPFEEFIKIVMDIYKFEQISMYAPILEGYEDANIRISGKNGEFVLKIFSKEKTYEQVKSYVDILKEAKTKKVPLVHLVKGKQGSLSTYMNGNVPVYYILSYFFHGKNFDFYTPYVNEIKDVTAILGHLNQIKIPAVENYDSWGNKNLVREYVEHEDEIPPDIKAIISPIVSEMKRLDMTNFSSSVIHGDLQRKHVLKNDSGEYCLLDLGCARYDLRVYDLSIHLAWFCLAEDTWDKKEEIASLVLTTYTKLNKLSASELASIPLLTKASYAAYLLRTSLLIEAGDMSDETHEWYNRSKKMLGLMNTWNWKI